MSDLTGLALLGGFPHHMQAYIEQARIAEQIIGEIAVFAPSPLEWRRYCEVCYEVCTNYPSPSLDTLRDLRFVLTIKRDCELTQNFFEKLHKAENKAGA